jgi:23S rRNA (adenine2503-C2)-methyltransferase
MNNFIWKLNLVNLTPASLNKLFSFLKFDRFIYKQVLHWLYVRNVTNVDDIHNLSDCNKLLIKSICYILQPSIKKQLIDIDNTVKLVLQLSDYKNVEVVLIPNRKNHFTLCLSSQAGCILNCSFCYTGKFKFNRNLNHSEIINQVLLAKRVLDNLFVKKCITNIVFMGMGEPFFNFDTLFSVIHTLVDIDSFNIRKSKITVSTSGIIENFERFYKLKVRLALSLHASNDILRTKIMSINKKYSIHHILDSCKIFTKREYLTIEYVMLKNINDSKKCAIELVNLLKNIKCKVCLIPFNYFSGAIYNCSDRQNIVSFKRVLKAHCITTTIRKSMGVNIYGACGQLSGKI